MTEADKEKKRAYDRAYDASHPEFLSNKRAYFVSYYRTNKKKFNSDCAERRRAKVAADPNYRLREHLRQDYGIDVSLYNAMVLQQGGKCAICQKYEVAQTRQGKIKSLCIDHCHETGLVRGLLCQACNRLLGDADDSIEILEASIEYLRAAKRVLLKREA